MCVRYNLHKAEAALRAVARALAQDFKHLHGVADRYNIRISDLAPVFARQQGETALVEMMFGLVPSFQRAHPKRKLLYNARSETVTMLPSFREAVRRRRCLIPANGFYESLTEGKFSRPFVLTLRDDKPFAIAGIWEPGLDQTLPPSFSMLTTPANATVAPLNDRMPVVLTGPDLARWIGEQPLPEAALRELCRPLPADRLVAREVNRYGNQPRADGPQCLAPPEATQSELNLGG